MAILTRVDSKTRKETEVRENDQMRMAAFYNLSLWYTKEGHTFIVPFLLDSGVLSPLQLHWSESQQWWPRGCFYLSSTSCLLEHSLGCHRLCPSSVIFPSVSVREASYRPHSRLPAIAPLTVTPKRSNGLQSYLSKLPSKFLPDSGTKEAPSWGLAELNLCFPGKTVFLSDHSLDIL